LYEGYGNAFLEAIYFKKPILVNRYKVFIDDIEPKGFELVTMNGYLTDDVVRQTANILNDKQRPKEMVDHNYRLALEHYSYASPRKQLALIEPKIFKSYSPLDNDFPQSAMGI
jgi:glycosyltransferase involved in cell wall biosynthesis